MTVLLRTMLCVAALAHPSLSAMAQEPQQTTAVYDDWVVQCSLLAAQPAEQQPPAAAAKAGDKATPAAAPPAFVAPAPSRSCEIVQTFIARETGGTLAKLAIGKIPGRDEIKGVLISPLGVYLADGALIKLDGAKEIKGVYTRCDTAGCFAEFALAKDAVADLKTAKAVTLQFMTAQRAPLIFSISLRGFAPAYDAALAQTR